MRPASVLLPLALTTLLLLPSAASARGGLRAATCQRDITPVTPGLSAAYEAAFGAPAAVNHTDPVYLAGFGTGREATGYHDRLWARGVVLDGRGGRVAIVSLDVVSYFENEIETIRGLLSPAAGIDFLVVTSTHQHEGPDTIGLWGPDDFNSGVDFGYLDFVNAAIADCVDEAAANLVKARVRWVTTDSAGLSLGTDPEDDGFGVSDGKVLVGDEALAPATDGRFVDSRLAVMQVVRRGGGRRSDSDSDSSSSSGSSSRSDHSKKKKQAKKRGPEVLATLVNFASHPESLGSNNTLITSDFPHPARQRLEQEYGGLAIWVAGDLGVLQGPLDIDVLDPVTGSPAPRRSFRFAEVHGTQLAERVIHALSSSRQKGQANPRISFAANYEIFVPLENPYFRLAGALGVLSPRRALYTDGVPDDSMTEVGFPLLLAEDIRTAVGALRIGKASFAVVPSELDPQIGEIYRKAMRGAKHTFILGLANDHLGYQLPKPKWDNSCNECFPFVVAGAEDACPVQPVDCNTVFMNNVGREVDPTVSGAILPLIEQLHE